MYKDAGVDVEAGYESVKLIKDHVKKTFRPEVLSGLGGFGGLFALDNKKYQNPVLVSGTDGVGTKLKIAFLMDKHDTIGIDSVAMCVNDIVCCGAEPLFFLDYIATGKNFPAKIEMIVKGMAEGCLQSRCSLIGGETAEMPGFYPEGEYDVAGFAVGIVEKDKIIDGSQIKAGDKLVGFASSGIHSNGYSLVRKLLMPSENNINYFADSLGCTIGEELLKPTKIYVATMLDMIEKFNTETANLCIKGISNITGGGFIENIPRMIPQSLGIKINKGTWEVLPIFDLLQKEGNIPEKDMYNTFNMGIGNVMAVSEDRAEELVAYANSKDYGASIIGEVTLEAGSFELV
jgi:phosphoribosylformylglycinamidine cyclo-ligase